MANTLAPAAPFDGELVLPIAAAKLYLRVDGGEEDDLIAALRDAAVDWVERYTAKGLSRRAWVWTTSGFSGVLRPSFGPIAAVTAITYRDPGGVPVQIVTEAWEVDGASILPPAGARWPAAGHGEGTVSVTFTAGYQDAGTEAPALLAAAKMLLGHLYANREVVGTGVVGELPFAVTMLCAPFRMPVIG